MAFSLALIVLAAGLSTLTGVTAFAIWWFFDQRRLWVTWIREDDTTESFKVAHDGGDKLVIDRYDCAVPLEPNKILYKRGWRSGKHVIVDGAEGVQVLPRSDTGHRVGYDVLTLMDTAWAQKWREDFPEGETIASVLADWLFGWGGITILILGFATMVSWLVLM